MMNLTDFHLLLLPVDTLSSDYVSITITITITITISLIGSAMMILPNSYCAHYRYRNGIFALEIMALFQVKPSEVVKKSSNG